MKLIADENIAKPLIEALRADGHEVIAISEVSPGIKDIEVLAMARERGAAVLTQDTDFGELVFGQAQRSSGVLLLRLAGLAKADRIARVTALMCAPEVLRALESGGFIAASMEKVRIRGA